MGDYDDVSIGKGGKNPRQIILACDGLKLYMSDIVPIYEALHSTGLVTCDIAQRLGNTRLTGYLVN